MDFDEIIANHEELLKVLQQETRLKAAQQNEFVKQLQEEKEYAEIVMKGLKDQVGSHQTVLQHLNSELTRVAWKTPSIPVEPSSASKESEVDLKDTLSIYGMAKPPRAAPIPTTTSG